MDPRIAEFLSAPLAMRPSQLSAVASLSPRAEGVAAYRADAEPYTRVGVVAHLPVSGPMCFGGGVWAWLFGMCDTERLCAALHEAAEDDAVATVLLDIDSPGGDTAGMADLVAACDAVKSAGKRLVAVAHDAAFSAAYWLASQADELCVTATAAVGSIGVFNVLTDDSRYYDEMGVRQILVASTPLKGVNVPGVGITEAQIAAEGGPVMRLHEAFVDAVANGRGVPADTVQAWAESPDAVGAQAVESGLADRVVGFRGLLAELVGGPERHTTTTNDVEINTMTQTKSAAAVAAAKTATTAAKAGDAADDTTDMQDQMDALRAEVDELKRENGLLKGQIDALTPDDTGEEEEEDTGASAFADYKRAFAAENIELTDRVKATIADAMDDGLTPRAAVRLHRRVEQATAASTGAVGASTSPLAAGRPAPAAGSARARWDAEIAKARAAGKSKAVAAEHVIRTHPGLREEMLEEVNA